jgi:hypothetical protein
LLVTACVLVHVIPATAQDLAGASPVGSLDVHELLERALPSPERGFTAAAANTRWWGLRELETRSLALGGGWRSLRSGLGLSQTGVPELGWTTLAAALGAATPGAGAAVRAATRRDRDAPWSVSHALAREAGVEVGAGAWLAAAPLVRAWASAPQLWHSGSSPPLARPLELGLRAGGETAVWCTLRAPRSGDDGERALGMSLALAPLMAWAEVRDAPIRGSAGLRARAGPIAVRTRVDTHPALGETLRFGVEWSPAEATR